LSEVASPRPRSSGGSCARADNPTVAWAKVSRVTVARRRLRVSVLAELPSIPGMAIKEQGGSKIGYWILTAILVVIAVYVYFRK